MPGGVQAALGLNARVEKNLVWGQRFGKFHLHVHHVIRSHAVLSSGLWFHFSTKGVDSGLVKDLKVVGDRLEGQGCSFSGEGHLKRAK